MTPSNPSPDAGAGTPLTAEEVDAIRAEIREHIGDHYQVFALISRLEAAARSRPATDPAGLEEAAQAVLDSRDGEVDGLGFWRVHRFVIERLRDALARSRPATDPAGLDVERLRVIATAAERLMKVLDLASSVHAPERRAARLALRAALDDRLSVADGPGPEERLRVARAVGQVWIDEILATPTLSSTGMSHPVAMVMAALDGETEPRELGISEGNESKFRALAALPVHREETGR